VIGKGLKVGVAVRRVGIVVGLALVIEKSRRGIHKPPGTQQIRKLGDVVSGIRAEGPV
jgi:hypothetical protein